MSSHLTYHPHLEPWRTLTSEFPQGAQDAEQLRFFLRFAVLAPSSYNTQPWLFTVKGNHLWLRADPARSRPAADPEGRELIMSGGAVLLQLRLAARYFGRQYELISFPDPQQPLLLASFRLTDSQPPTSEEKHLFEAIPQRHTWRHPFASKLVADRDLRHLRTAAEDEMAYLQMLGPGKLHLQVADLVAESVEGQMDDPHFREEWTKWMRQSAAEPEDGLPGQALGWNDHLLPWMNLATALPPVRTHLAEAQRIAALEAPLLVVLETAGDTPQDWLQAGQALDRMLLAGAAAGLGASYLHAPLQSPHQRRRLQQLISATRFPQAFLRMGYVENAPPTPRRDVDAVLCDWQP